LQFFLAEIRNDNTREAYARAVGRFLRWCDSRRVVFGDINTVTVSAYVQHLCAMYPAPTVKQHLAAIRRAFDYLVTGGLLAVNPAWPVRGPRHSVTKGKTPVLSAREARELLDSIDIRALAGLRDRAMIAVMVFAVARVGAMAAMRVKDYNAQGKRWRFTLHEKGGKLHHVEAHRLAERYVDEYLEAAGIAGERDRPLFRTVDRGGRLTAKAVTRNDVLRMVKRRARAAGLSLTTCCHTFRATGITEYRRNGGTLDKAARMANHSSTRTTQLYDRSDDPITLEEIERIRI
jgi:site-specific recombinase XerD